MTGENGILTQANNAKERTEEAEDIEKIKLAIMGSKISLDDGYNKIDEEEIKKELETQFGENNVLITKNSDMTYTIKLIETQKEYDILTDGEIQQLDRIMSPTSVYAIIYSDGTLAFNTTGDINQEKINNGITVIYNTKNDENIGDISKSRFED